MGRPSPNILGFLFDLLDQLMDWERAARLLVTLSSVRQGARPVLVLTKAIFLISRGAAQAGAPLEGMSSSQDSVSSPRPSRMSFPHEQSVHSRT